MGGEDSKQTQASLIEYLNEGKKIRLEANKIKENGDSKQSRLEVSDVYAKAAEIYRKAVRLIKDDSSAFDSADHDRARLAFLACYGHGISLHWKVQYALDQDDDNYSLTKEQDDDVNMSKDMLYEAVQIAKKHSLDLPWEESIAHGLVAEELEEKEEYEEAFESFHKMYSIYESQGVEYDYIVGSGLRMVSCFMTAEESEENASWLVKRASTAMNCLEGLISICVLAEKGNKEILARFSSRLTSYLAAFLEDHRKSAEQMLEGLKGRYPDVDVLHVDKKARSV